MFRLAASSAFRHRVRNLLHTALLLAAMAALAGFLGWVLFGTAAVFWAALVGPVVVAFIREVPPSMVLRMNGAKEIALGEAPALRNLVGTLAQRAGLPKAPRLYWLPTKVLNAFAAGSPKNPAIAVSDGMLRSLDGRELAGVLAHEFAHLRANDLRVMTLAAVVARMTSVLSRVGLLILILMIPLALVSSANVPWLVILALMVSPWLSMMLQLGLARTREYDADRGAAEISGDPRGLALALAKLERQQGGWMERMLQGRVPAWLRTHPSTRERIRRLNELEGETGISLA